MLNSLVGGVRALGAEPATAPADAQAAATQPGEAILKGDVPPLPEVAPAGVIADLPTFSFMSKKIGDTRNTKMTLRGRITQIVEGPDGIQMTVTGYLDGQRTTKEFKAKNGDELKKAAPQWYELWANSGGGTGQLTVNGNDGPIIINGGNVFIPAPGGQAALRPPAPSDDLTKLRMDLDKEMGNLTDAKRAAVVAQLTKVNVAQQEIGTGVDPGKENQHYLDECDALRKAMADAGLADPGTLLPPPANARLGVTVTEAGIAGGGVIVSSVIEGSRAQKMGVQPKDVIVRINDMPVTDVKELRAGVMDNNRLILSVMRGGQTMALNEPAATQPGK